MPASGNENPSPPPADPRFDDWLNRTAELMRNGPCVLVTLNRIAGSAPRESGARMLVAAERTFGSIGGGRLEFTATQRARALLAESSAPRQRHEPYGLGPEMQQCCGGAVTVLYEVLSGDIPAWLSAAIAARDSGEAAVLAQAIDAAPPVRSVIGFRGPGEPPAPPAVRDAARALLAAAEGDPRTAGLPSLPYEGQTWWLERLETRRWPLFLFGAGHVGREVARLLERLPFDLVWIDNRADAFPKPVPPRIRARVSADPAGEAAAAPPGTLFIVMTHSHPLDEDICHAILQRGDFGWLGLIGSDSKRRRFAQRLGRRGIGAGALERMVCPIGLAGIRGKQPATIALSLAAQLMTERPWTHADN